MFELGIIRLDLKSKIPEYFEYFDFKYYTRFILHEFQMYISNKKHEIFKKTSFQMEVDGLTEGRAEKGIVSSSWDFKKEGVRTDLHIEMMEIFNHTMLYIIVNLLMFLYISIPYTRITILFRLNSMAFLIYHISTTLPPNQDLLLNSNPFPHLNTNP